MVITAAAIFFTFFSHSFMVVTVCIAVERRRLSCVWRSKLDKRQRRTKTVSIRNLVFEAFVLALNEITFAATRNANGKTLEKKTSKILRYNWRVTRHIIYE